MIGALIISYLLFPIIYYIVKIVARLRNKKKPNSGSVLIATFVIVNIVWIGGFLLQFVSIGGGAGEVAFFFIGIPILIILLGLFIGA